MSIRPADWHPWRGGVARPAEEARTCRLCGETKPLAAFPRSGGAGRYTTCRPCHNARRRASPEDRSRKRERERERYRADPSVKIRANRRNRHRRLAREGRPVTPAPHRWWSVVRAAIELGHGEAWVQARCRSGELRAIKAINHPHGGYCWRIDPASVAELKRGGE